MTTTPSALSSATDVEQHVEASREISEPTYSRATESGSFRLDRNGGTDIQQDSKLLKQAPAKIEAFKTYRLIVSQLLLEVRNLNSQFAGDELQESGLGSVVRVEAMLEQLFDCAWGEGESLQRAVVAVESQVKNAEWGGRHVKMLEDVFTFLSTRYLIDDMIVDQVMQIIEANGLDIFRGTTREPVTNKRYKIVEWSDNGEVCGSG